jgi:molecular chaperone DnaK
MRKLGVGIDFGTTNSIASVWGEDVRRLVENEGSDPKPPAFWFDDPQVGLRPHPSVVWFKPDDSVVVGFEARRNMQELAGSLGHDFVRSIKRSLVENQEVVSHSGQRYEPYEVAAKIFEHLREDGQRRPELAGHEFRNCVVTVPVGFKGPQRRQIRRAMERAGLELQSFLHEPFAALISHFYDSRQKLAAMRGKRALVFDWGGGTLDICVVEGSKDGSRIYELAHDGVADRAGDDFDKRIMTLLRSRFLEKNPDLSDDDIDARSRAQDRFWMASENGKIGLSSATSVRIAVANFLDGDPPLDLGERLLRDEFEGLIEAEIKAAAACTRRCLEMSRLSPANIDYVLMVGGTSLIPRIKRELEDIFGAKVHVTTEPDAAIARGAAIVAAEEWTPFNAVELGLQLSDDSFFTILEHGAPLLAESSKKLVFYCTDPRVGCANFIFCRRSIHGDQSFQTTGEFMNVPVSSERVSRFQDIDRIIVGFSVSKDATLLCTAKHTGSGEVRSHEISDVSFGLQLNGNSES